MNDQPEVLKIKVPKDTHSGVHRLPLLMKSDANPKLSILLQGEFACTNFMKLYQETKSAHA